MENVNCKNVKAKYISVKDSGYGYEIYWFKIIGKKNMKQIIDLYNANEELKKKNDENYVPVNFPFFFGVDDDLMLKTKVDAVDVEDLDKNKAYKLNILFKAYDFVVQGGTRKKGYVVSLIEECQEKEKENKKDN